VRSPPPEVAALSRALPDALPPEVLFGIGGGAGFGRCAFGDTVMLHTRITTRETAGEGFLATICRQLQAPFRIEVDGGAEPLRRRLHGELAAGRTPVVWIGPERLPWAGPPAADQAAAVLELRADESLVFDGEERHVPTRALLEAARASGVPYRTLTVDGPPGEIGTAVRAGLVAHRQQMREGFGPPDSRSAYGLAGLAVWTVQVAGDAGRGPALAAQIRCRGGGAAMREAQAAFLAFAGHERAAGAAAAAAGRWAELAVAFDGGHAGPDHVRAVHDAEAESLAAVEAALRSR
jgi:hypothetical protein